MLSQILASHEQLPDWVKWLVTSTCTPAVESRVFLDRALHHLPVPNRVRKRLQSVDAGGVDAILHELLMFEVCTILRMNPAFEPNVGGQHPDLSVCIKGKSFLADVVVASRPISTMHPAGDGYLDCGQAARKLAERVEKKTSKYARLNQPLIVFVMFGRVVAQFRSGHGPIPVLFECYRIRTDSGMPRLDIRFSTSHLMMASTR